MNPEASRGPRSIPLALVHHANQLSITDGYESRQGITDVLGSPASPTGLRRVLDLHRQYRVPLNLHISGVFLESIAWHSPEFLSTLGDLGRQGLLEIVGSAYGQNIMPFFSSAHNRRQLTEGLLAYRNLLGWEPDRIKAFWPPERVWNTEVLAATVADLKLPNGGYRYVLVDDRLLLRHGGEPSPRRSYDYERPWDPRNFLMYEIEGGHGLRAIPIALNLRQHIPPRSPEAFARVRDQLLWLSDMSSDYGDHLLAVYADDLEKSAGAGWSSEGPGQYEEILRWASRNGRVRPVKITDWASAQEPTARKIIDPGTYAELANEFGASETYANWYDDARWRPYREQYAWAEGRVEALEREGADSGLMELAWKTLLATAWQTAWHTPKTGAHGNTSSDGGPSAWVRAIASHCRLAAIIAEAAHWMDHKDHGLHADLVDLDHDGDPELVLKNDRLFAVFSPRNGGRLVYMFHVGSSPGALGVGNPVDDWNLLEDLHRYMDTPPNHPGALVDVGYEHDRFAVSIETSTSQEARIGLQNVQEDSPAVGLRKTITLGQDRYDMRIDYALPPGLTRLSSEIGFSPDYLHLLRYGEQGVRLIPSTSEVRGWTNESVFVWARLAGDHAVWDTPRQPKFGHGYLLRATGVRPGFTLWMGVEGTT